MKILFLPVLHILCLQSFAQKDTTVAYFNRAGMETDKATAAYYSKIYRSEGLWKRKNYWINTDSLFSELSFMDDELEKKQGTSIQYFKSGRVKDSAYYENNRKRAVWYYHENGKKLSYATFNEKGRVAEQVGWDETGNEIKDFIVEREAQFPGGPEGWKRYLERNLNANVAANDRAPVGLYPVKVQFIVDKEGNVANVKAVSVPDLCPSCGIESERIIKKGPKWIPAVQNGKQVIYQAVQFLTYQVSQ